MGYEIRLLPPSSLYSFQNQLTVDLRASEEIVNDEFKEYLKYGIVIHYTYFINFYRQQFFFDEVIDSKKLQVSLKYNLWSKQYTITEFPQKKTKNFNDINEVINQLVNLKQIKILPLSSLNYNEKYYFKTRLTAKISEFESYFHIIFSLMSIFKYKTTYLESKSYSGEALLSLTPKNTQDLSHVMEK